MGEYIEYNCDNCGWTYIKENDIFFINKNHEISVEPLLMLSLNKIIKNPVSGHYSEYYCYNCEKSVQKFIITENDGELENTIIKDIENYGNSLKIIDFDDKFQKCLTCNKQLELNNNRIKSFVLTENDKFEIINDPFPFIEDYPNYKFMGKYYGYFCKDCRKQINKFIIESNPSKLTTNEIKDILNENTANLTIYEEKYSTHCPECGDEISILKNSSKCPKCMKGKLIEEIFIFID